MKNIFTEIEEYVGKKWQNNNTFQQSIENRKDEKDFVFYDGPPFANGLPHYGHLLTGFVKDIVCRYQTINGKKVARKFGWDCHGLPAEMESEKELKIQGRQAIQDFGIDKFNSHCESSVMKYSNEWEYYVTKQGRWVEFQNSYKTMDSNYMESVIWAFKTLYDKGLIYQGYKVMYYSWKCQTPLSNFEARLDNSYRQKESKALTVRFKLKTIPNSIIKNFSDYDNVYLLSWTTTPWTLPSNLMLGINKNFQYSAIKKNRNIYIFASNLKEKTIPIIEDFENKKI